MGDGLFNKLKHMKLLLIDDDKWIRDSMCLFFESEGCHLTALETAEEGLEELNSLSYDILIVDYRLPGMDGLTFFEQIQAFHPDAKKILITAYGSDEAVSKAKRMGIHEFIQKPFTSKTIETSLRRLINLSGEEEMVARSAYDALGF